MNKMNLREFAEVMCALINNAGVSCVIDNNAPDGQLRFAASKNNATVYTDVSSLWKQCNETDADLQQLAMAIAEALKQALGEAEKEAPRFQPRQSAAGPRHQAPVDNKADNFETLTRALEKTVKRKAMQQKMTSEEEKDLSNLDAFLASLYGNKNHSCGCGCGCGHFEPEEKQEKPESEGYDPMNDLPDGLREAIGGLLDELSKKSGIKMHRQAKPAAEPSEEEIVKSVMLENVLPMIVTAEEFFSHPGALGRKFFDMYIVYYIKEELWDKYQLPHNGPAVLNDCVVKGIGVTEKDIYSAAMKNMSAYAEAAPFVFPVAGKILKAALISAPECEYGGAAAVLTESALGTATEVLESDKLVIFFMTTNVAVAFPFETTDLQGLNKAVAASSKDIVAAGAGGFLNEKLFVYDKDNSCLVCPAYNL